MTSNNDIQAAAQQDKQRYSLRNLGLEPENDTHTDVQSIPMDANDKLNLLLTHNDTTDQNFASLRSQISLIRKEVEVISTVKAENVMIKQHLSVAIGKIDRLEHKEEAQHQKIVRLEQHSFRKDIVIYNFPESQQESTSNLTNSVYQFFNKTMHVHTDLLFHPRNPGGEVRIDNCFRLGKRTANKTRPVIVSLLTQLAKQTIMDKKYISVLTKNSKIRITHRYQSEIRERREAQVDSFKTLKTERKETNDKINLVEDKIIINNVRHQDKNFINNPLPSLTSYSIDYSHIQHGTQDSKDDSHFQGHCALVENIQQATAAKNAIMQSPNLSSCDHLMYAYRIKDSLDDIEYGYSDDRETKSGKILYDILSQQEKTNVFLCVTRLKNGNNIGQDRFNLIRSTATEALSLPLKPEVPDQFYLRLS